MIKFVDYNYGKYELKNGKSSDSIFLDDVGINEFIDKHRRKIDLQFFSDLFSNRGEIPLEIVDNEVLNNIISKLSKRKFMKFYSDLLIDTYSEASLLLKKPKLCAKLLKSNALDVKFVLSIQDMLSLPISESEKLKYLINNYSSSVVVRNLNGGTEKERQRIMDVLKSTLKGLNADEIFCYCNIIPKKELTIELYEKCKKQLDNFGKYAVLIKIASQDQRAEKLMQKLKLNDNVKHMLERLCNANISPSQDKSIKLLVNSNIISELGEDNVYNIIKFGVVGGSLPNIKHLIDDPTCFKKYCEYRKLNMEQGILQPKNVLEALEEFSKHYDLIKDCVNKDLTKNEKAIFASAVKEEFKINGRNDLKNYAQIRTEYLNNTIKTKDINFAISYIFSKMSFAEFEEKEKLFFNDNQLETTLNDFNKEMGNKVELINIAKQLQKSIRNENREKQAEYLNRLVKDLENEFNPQGSHFASLRNSFGSFEKEVQKHYGEELSNSLQRASNSLPKPEKQDGVDVYNLQGEEFMLLIHGLGAYNSSISTQWEHKELGHSYLCTSLISNTHMHRASASIYYGFKNISSEALILEGATDINSRDKSLGSLNITASTGVHFSKSEDLLEETKQSNRYHYNEIVLRREQFDENGKAKPITPDYIVAFDQISYLDKQEAQRLNIPIVFIHTKIYAQQIEVKNAEKNKVSNEKTAEVSHKKTLAGLSYDEAMELIDGAHTKVDATDQQNVIHEIKELVNNNYEESVNV